jgi:hypothetical protein
MPGPSYRSALSLHCGCRTSRGLVRAWLAFQTLVARFPIQVALGPHRCSPGGPSGFEVTAPRRTRPALRCPRRRAGRPAVQLVSAPPASGALQMPAGATALVPHRRCGWSGIVGSAVKADAAANANGGRVRVGQDPSETHPRLFTGFPQGRRKLWTTSATRMAPLLSTATRMGRRVGLLATPSPQDAALLPVPARTANHFQQ